MDEKELIKQGYKKDIACVHIQEYDPYMFNGKEVPFRRLSYDLTDSFTDEQLDTLNKCFNEINKRFPNIKILLSGTGWTKQD